VSFVTDSASISEIHLIEAALACIPTTIRLPNLVPVIADRGYDSDPLRETLRNQGFILISPHRRNRTSPPTNDGRRMRRYSRRYIIERTNAWLHSYRRVITRFERIMSHYDGFVSLACAFIALGKAVLK
jgi:transposase